MKYSVTLMALALPVCWLHGAFANEPVKAQPASAQSGLAVLAKAREASPESAWRNIRGLTAKGHVETSGLSGTWTRTEDAKDGRFVVAPDLGVMRIADGNDGRVHWRQDPSGGVHPLNGAFAQAATHTDAWLTRREWLRAGAGSARIGHAESRSDEGRQFLVLEATPPRGQPVEMWFDAATFLLDRTVRIMPISTQTVRYADYRPVSGLPLPHRIETSETPSPNVERVRIDQWQLNNDVKRAQFVAPAPPDDTTLIGETTVPLEIQGFVVVQAKLNGRAFDFILDTGGHNIITPETAEILGLHPVGEGASGGSGPGTLAEQYVSIDRLELGAATLRDQHFYVLPFSYDTVERGGQAPLAGLLGLEIFERFAARIDYPNAKLTLRKLDSYRHQGAGVPVPITFDDDMPLLEGKIDGTPGLIALDTGNGASLVVQPVWARRHGLAESLKRGIETVSYGAGGASPNWASRVNSVELGGANLPRPIVRYAEDTAGSFSSRTEAANIGTEILSHFVLDIDYRRGVIWFAFRPGYVPPPFNRAGLRAVKDDAQAFRVVRIAPGSPASLADLATDDRILTVDGTPAEQLSGRNLGDKFIQPVGTNVVLTVDRGGAARTVVLTLREMLP